MLTKARGADLGAGGGVGVTTTTGLGGMVNGASAVGIGAVCGGRCAAWHAKSNSATPSAAAGHRRLTRRPRRMRLTHAAS